MDLSMSDFKNPYRMCVVAKFLVPTLQFVIRFKCGYEKHVEADELIEMADQSKALKYHPRKKVHEQVLEAAEEWQGQGKDQRDITWQQK